MSTNQPLTLDLQAARAPENTNNGRYRGIIIAETDTHYIQQTSVRDEAAYHENTHHLRFQRMLGNSIDQLFSHPKSQHDDPNHTQQIRVGEPWTFTYNNGKFTGEPATLPIAVALYQTRKALGPTAEVKKADTQSGIYYGPIIGETQNHLLQQIGKHTAVMHEKERLSHDHSNALLETGKPYSIRYSTRGRRETAEIRLLPQQSLQHALQPSR